MAFASPFQTLIEEIVSDIFLKCLPENNLARMRRKQAPLNVSHVCRHWRYVSLSTRPLWAHLHLRCPTDESTLEYALPILRVFLQRSGSAELYIKIDCAEDDNELRFVAQKTVISWPTVEVIFHELASQSDRIKGFTFKMPQTLCEKAVKFSIDTLPALDRLSLQCFFSRDARLPTELDKTFWKVVSRLQSLEFKGTMYFKYCPDDIETSAVKHLALHSTSSQALFRLLGSCPALESLHLYAGGSVDFVSSTSENDEERQFPSIRSLELTAHYPSLLRTFLMYARLPNLRCLTVAVRRSEHIEPDLTTFLVASCPPLEELRLVNNLNEPSYEGGHLIYLLKSLPNLKRLRINLHQAVTRALVLSDGGNKDICPLLEEVTFDIREMSYEESAQTWTATEDMIRSRWETPKSCLSTTSRSESRPAMVMYSIAAPRKLRRVNFPDIKEEQLKGHQLFKYLKDCQHQGLLLTFRGD